MIAMLEQVRLSIGLQYARLRFRSNHDTARLMTRFFTSARRILVVLPFNDEDLLHARDIVGWFVRQFGTDSTVLLTPQNFVVREIRETPRVIHLRKDACSAFLIPKRPIIEEVKAGGFDVAIDLNRNLVLPVVFLLKAAGVPFRVGFDIPRIGDFYNVLIRVSQTELSGRYASFYNHLLMF
ncbi:MAG: hypothetical protein COS95_04820 [Ignavibacteriales bacterium CG07_land_8_20_14_0_80_59_12]|nr:MAG: hypothetical protein COS95_04820 [Ignavibacteriales bacterium CG07_land_8_20_14_0_80_59_12]